MTPTNQTKFSAFTSKGERITYGNCLVACIASILDVDIHEVPNVYTLYGITPNPERVEYYNPYWAQVLNMWMRDKHGKELEIMTAIAYASRVTKDANYPRTAIVKGMSHRDKPHCCIYHLSTLIWDPHPSREGLKEMLNVYVIRKLVDAPVKDINTPEGYKDTFETEMSITSKSNTITGDVKDVPETLTFLFKGQEVDQQTFIKEWIKSEANLRGWPQDFIDSLPKGEITTDDMEHWTPKIDPLQAIEERKKALAELHEDELKHKQLVYSGVADTFHNSNPLDCFPVF